MNNLVTEEEVAAADAAALKAANESYDLHQRLNAQKAAQAEADAKSEAAQREADLRAASEKLAAKPA